MKSGIFPRCPPKQRIHIVIVPLVSETRISVSNYALSLLDIKRKTRSEDGLDHLGPNFLGCFNGMGSILVRNEYWEMHHGA